jgi:signal transduction histidine kinase
MWSRIRQSITRPRLQHERIQAAAFWILLIRLWEGAACWTILTAVLVPPTVPRFIIHANFALYVALNTILFVRQRHASLTPGWVWADIAANMVPMFGGLYWTGGVHSPLLPIFVLKLLWYGLIFGADVGMQALAGTLLVGAYLTAADLLGLDLPEPVAMVSTFGQQWLRLGFALLIYTTLVASSLRFARITQEHEADLAATVREKERLYARALDHERALQQLSRRMMQMSEETLQQVARDLHDHLGQSLTAVRMEVGLIERQLSDHVRQRDQLGSVRRQLGSLLQSVRDLSRLLRPPVLDDLGLVPALQSLVERFMQQSEIAISLDTAGTPRRLPNALEVALYRVVQEALANIARHSMAKSGTIRLEFAEDLVSLRITDNGQGFDVEQQERSGHFGIGLVGMRERVAAHGGELIVASDRATGTKLDLRIPVPPGAAPTKERNGQDKSVASG